MPPKIVERLVGEELARFSYGSGLPAPMGPDLAYDGRIAEPLSECAPEISRRIGRTSQGRR